MLIQITNKCLMGCSHCMPNSTPEGQHMNEDTWEKTLDFIKRLSFPVLNGWNMPTALISGGEPTENPLFKRVIEDLLANKQMVYLISNGMWIEDKDKTELISTWIKKYPKMFDVQVTNVKEYYPKRVDFKKLKAAGVTAIEKEIRLCEPFGRAKTNNLPEGSYVRRAPACFDYRNNTGGFPDLKSMMQFFMGRGKLCFPVVGIDGSVYVSENSECEAVGTVCDSAETLYQAIKDCRCENCGMTDRLTGEYKEHWDKRVMGK